MKKHNIARFIWVFILVCCVGFLVAAPSYAAAKKGKLSAPPKEAGYTPEPLPKKGFVAILVKGEDEQHAAAVTSIMAQQLRARGYKIVDEKKLAAIRRDKANRLALEGNVEAILKLGSQYGVSVSIVVQERAGEPRENEFGLYTGTSSLAVQAVSGASLVYADTVQGKQVGYTQDEAAQKSIEAAARLAVDRMTQ
ncbi:hypothetical protein AGMMS50276_09370 [Synergistales bacterium]|nr:hypothetical protein AGMMS50276_09370 [Synergistales bacterium]